jgi:hypothetical protein
MIHARVHTEIKVKPIGLKNTVNHNPKFKINRIDFNLKNCRPRH